MSTAHHQEDLNTVFTAIGTVFVMLVLLASASRRQQNHDKYRTYCCEYSVEILLMMGSGHVRNM